MIYCQLCCLEFEDKTKLREHEASTHSSFFCPKCDSYTTKKQTGRTRCHGCNELMDVKERAKSTSPKEKGKTASQTPSSQIVTTPSKTSSVVRLIPLSSLISPPGKNPPPPNLLSMQPISVQPQTSILSNQGPVYRISLPTINQQSGPPRMIFVRKSSTTPSTPPILPLVPLPPENICSTSTPEVEPPPPQLVQNICSTPTSITSTTPEVDPPPPKLVSNTEINTGAVRGHVPKQPVQCPMCRQWFNSKDVIISMYFLNIFIALRFVSLQFTKSLFMDCFTVSFVRKCLRLRRLRNSMTEKFMIYLVVFSADKTFHLISCW